MNNLDLSIGGVWKSGLTTLIAYLGWTGVIFPGLMGFAGKDYYSTNLVQGISYDLGAKTTVVIGSLGSGNKPEPVLKTPADVK
jgi:hypothetical protein